VRALLFLLGIAVALPIAGQEDKPQPDAKPRVFIAAGAAWRKNGPGSSPKSELEYRRVEIAGDFSRSCGATIVVTTNIKDAYYVAEFSRHATGVPLPAIAVNRTDVNVYRTNADLVGASSKSSLGGAVKAACEVMTKDWPNAPRDLTPKRRDVHPTGRTASFPQ
jgi:hypothetical protein